MGSYSTTRSSLGIAVIRSDRLPHVAPFVLAGVLSFCVLAARPVQAQAPCDPSLTRSTADPWAYRVRGDRCEGTYAQPVAGTPLIVASFTGRFDSYDTDSTDHLVLRWPTAGSGAVRLRAMSLRRRFYYRMDAEQPVSAGSWEWPVDLLAALELGRPELGVVAWHRLSVGGAERDVHLPLSIAGSGEANADGDGYVLVVMPQVELTEVYVTVSRMDRDGRPVDWLRDEEPLGYGYYPADRPVDVPIERPAEPGLYRVLLGARIRAGGSVASELWFQVSD